MTIGLLKVHMPAAVDKPLLETLHSGYIGQGKKVEEFEKKLSERLGTTNVLTLNSGTSAIVLALRLAGIGPGDQVVTTHDGRSTRVECEHVGRSQSLGKLL